MLESRQHVIALLDAAFVELGPLADALTLVGGCLTPLLITDLNAPQPRVTIDVDLVVKSVTNHEYSQFSDLVRKRGFRQGEAEDDPICRFRKGAIILDILPIDPTVLRFGNQWYALAADTAVGFALPSGILVRHASAPCFLATKIEAFQSRGNGDYLGSPDWEDIVALIDGRPELQGEIDGAPEELRTWIRDRLVALQKQRGFIDSLPGMVPGSDDIVGRVELVLSRFRAISAGS